MTDYKDALNLPNTSFAMKAGLPVKEPKMIEFWEEMEHKGAKLVKGGKIYFA